MWHSSSRYNNFSSTTFGEYQKDKQDVLYSGFSFSPPLCSIRLLPVTSTHVPLCHTLTLLLRSEYLVPQGWAVVFVCVGSGWEAKESPLQPSVKLYAIPTRTNWWELFAASTIINGHLLPHICVWVCVVVGLVKKPGSLLWNNWFSKLPTMFHPKEVTGVKAGEGSRRLISEQTNL